MGYRLSAKVTNSKSIVQTSFVVGRSVAVETFIEGFIVVGIEEEVIAGAVGAGGGVQAHGTVWHGARAEPAKAKTICLEGNFVKSRLVAADALFVAIEKEETA